MFDLTVDEELEHLLPPLSDEEFANLERDIVANGVREAIIVWAGHGVIADGHNRYRICKKHGISYAVTEMEFPDKPSVADWMVRNQKSRRNLTKGQEADIAIRLHEVRFREEAKRKQDENRRANLKQNRRPPRDPQLGVSGNSHNESGNSADETQTSEHVEDVFTPEPKPTKNRDNETARRIAKESGIGKGTVERVMAVHKSGEQDLIDGIQSGRLSAGGAYEEMKRRRRESEVIPVLDPDPGDMTLNHRAYDGTVVACDLLVTEAPDDPSWLYSALSGVRHTGFAYVFVNPAPDVLAAYLGADVPMNVELSQVLVWSFNYMLGNADNRHYKPSWKAILFYRGTDAGGLNFPRIGERLSVHAVNAENDGLGKPGYELRMPMALARRLMCQAAGDGGVVFDPFAHEGTFLLAASEAGCDAIGYESDDGKVARARERGVSVVQ